MIPSIEHSRETVWDWLDEIDQLHFESFCHGYVCCILWVNCNTLYMLKVIFPVDLLTAAKHTAFSANHLADIDKTDSFLNQSPGWYWQNRQLSQPITWLILTKLNITATNNNTSARKLLTYEPAKVNEQRLIWEPKLVNMATTGQALCRHIVKTDRRVFPVVKYSN